MDPTFEDIAVSPENNTFHVVMFPDRIYHARYLNATVSDRYRYRVTEVRDKHDVCVMKGDIYLDGRFLTRFLRIEYRASRLVEAAREQLRFVENRLNAWLQIVDRSKIEAQLNLHYCRWIDAYQVEVWQSLETPPHQHHDVRVQAMMGMNTQITRVPAFAEVFKNLQNLNEVHLAFSESEKDDYRGYHYSEPEWDNNYHNTYQAPNNPTPSSSDNDVYQGNYALYFQKGWFLRRAQVAPVRYKNPLMEDGPEDNIVDMRWILQDQLGGKLTYFHEVSIPPNAIEGSHRHIGSEEVYYIIEGKGVAYMGDGDDPTLDTLPLEDVDIFKIGNRACRRLSVKTGDTIFTKSGGIHGIKNESDDTTLRFVAFAYHCR
jgi:quercetin dioxygenase-like cupin family protein